MCSLRENFDTSCLFIGGYDIFRWGTRKKYYILKILQGRVKLYSFQMEQGNKKLGFSLTMNTCVFDVNVGGPIFYLYSCTSLLSIL